MFRRSHFFCCPGNHKYFVISFYFQELADIHEKFLERLKDAVSENSKSKLSQVFLDFREPFLIYGDYCSSMTAAVEMLNMVCKRSPLVEQCMEHSQKEHSGGKNQLRDILSVPMQRILKYHLLLDKLVKETSPVSRKQNNFNANA